MPLLNAEQHEYLKSIVKGRFASEVTKMVNEKYGLELSEKQIKSYKKTHKLKSGVDTTFKDGHMPFNIHCKPHNILPVGSERLDIDGYYKVKVAATDTLPERWRPKHHVIYEAVHDSMPEGHILLFADQDKHNLDINNLILVSKEQRLVMIRKKLLFDDADLTKTGLTIAKLSSKVRERITKG